MVANAFMDRGIVRLWLFGFVCARLFKFQQKNLNSNVFVHAPGKCCDLL